MFKMTDIITMHKEKENSYFHVRNINIITDKDINIFYLSKKVEVVITI